MMHVLKVFGGQHLHFQVGWEVQDLRASPVRKDSPRPLYADWPLQIQLSIQLLKPFEISTPIRYQA